MNRGSIIFINKFNNCNYKFKIIKVNFNIFLKIKFKDMIRLLKVIIKIL